jgi:hypothetical protein
MVNLSVADGNELLEERLFEIFPFLSNETPRGARQRSISLLIYNLLQIEWVRLGGLSQVECDSKGFFVNVTITSSRHVCAHAKIEEDEAPER